MDTRPLRASGKAGGAFHRLPAAASKTTSPSALTAKHGREPVGRGDESGVGHAQQLEQPDAQEVVKGTLPGPGEYDAEHRVRQVVAPHCAGLLQQRELREARDPRVGAERDRGVGWADAQASLRRGAHRRTLGLEDEAKAETHREEVLDGHGALGRHRVLQGPVDMTQHALIGQLRHEPLHGILECEHTVFRQRHGESSHHRLRIRADTHQGVTSQRRANAGRDGACCLHRCMTVAQNADDGARDVTDVNVRTDRVQQHLCLHTTILTGPCGGRRSTHRARSGAVRTPIPTQRFAVHGNPPPSRRPCSLAPHSIPALPEARDALTDRSAVRSRTEQIPSVPGNVDEDGDLPVGLAPRFGHELDAHLFHTRVSGLEVLDPQEQPDASRELIPDRTGLLLAVGLSEQQSACRSRRPYDHPSLGSSVVSDRRQVFDELKAEHVDEEPDGLVVVVDDQCELLEVHAYQPITTIRHADWTHPGSFRKKSTQRWDRERPINGVTGHDRLALPTGAFDKPRIACRKGTFCHPHARQATRSGRGRVMRCSWQSRCGWRDVLGAFDDHRVVAIA